MPPADTSNPLTCHFGKSISGIRRRRGFFQIIQNPVIFILTSGFWKDSKYHRSIGLIAFVGIAYAV